ncbi:glycosyltransferase family 2 protein [Sphingomonas mesophila]|uniref:glycosyltransferase family 2 protein n=1 Tax=Sphingomonas mesophila TaxID=2303576 RepID=UPI001967D95A|nr:glycosyltransferase family 2 protein [Sphingomonas mesophila]
MLSSLVGRVKRYARWKTYLSLTDGIAKSFRTVRVTEVYQGAFTKPSPLVSICIATFNRADLLTTRCLKSVLAQTYENLEVIVVSDGGSDDTAQRIEMLGDPRVRFFELPRRGEYPADPYERWCVGGTLAMNCAMAHAGGDFITHLDDDDEFHPERVERLVQQIQAERADFLYHPFWFQKPDGEWGRNEAGEIALGKVTSSSVFYHHWLRQLGWDPFAYRYGEPGDWNRFRRFREIGVRAARAPGAMLRHYREASQGVSGEFARPPDWDC